jgi:Mg2+ and Co2+ transporter CorA
VVLERFALPIIPGLFGMNVGGVPLQHAGGFWMLVVVVAGLAGLAGKLAFRQRIDS